MSAVWRAICGSMLGAWLLSSAAAQPIAGVPTDPKLEGWPVQRFDLRTLSPEDSDFSDLLPLERELAGVRVVALGEQSHGGREEFQLKLRLLRFLHEKLGFEVLLLESGFYDLGRLSQQMAAGQSLDDQAPGNVFYMYSKSAEGRQLLQYLDRQQRGPRPLLLAGIDSQHSGELSLQDLLPSLRKRISLRAPTLASDTAWTPFAKLAQPLLTLQVSAPAHELQQDFFQRATTMRESLCAETGRSAGPESDGWWCQVLDSLMAQARSLWSQGRDFQRDLQMGANAIWLMERQFPGKKAVVWAHTVHVARGFERSPQHPQAGEVMHRHWGPAYKVVNFSSAAGEVLDDQRLQARPLPQPLTGSLEAVLAASKSGPQALMARAPLVLKQHSFEYQSAGIEGAMQPGQLGRHWDILFYIPRMSPVQMVR